jgi:polyferredoxin
MSPKGNVTLDPATLSKIAKLARVSFNIQDEKATDEAEAMAAGEYEDIQRRKFETAGLRERNRDRRINRKLRTNYARSVLCYLIWYSVFVGILLLMAGFKICGFVLPESVLGFLVGSTTAAAIGLVFAVTNGLFSGLEK